ncbi:MAG: beta-lactamase family protein [Propionibacteriales bacterium]|nr:beta-lactamase family protein [Propionibacteriales bacterium]
MTPVSEQSAKALRRILLERQTEGRVPGMVGAVSRGRHLMWHDGIGAADLNHPGTPPAADTQFLIASISKTFTAVLVMALRDEGKVTLDDTLDQHVRDSQHGGVTIRQLLSHVSGMQREPVGDVWDALAFPDRSTLIEGWNEADRILKPHSRWHYSNLGYSLLGELIAQLDGREWRESLQARILDPLEMRRTTLGLVAPNAGTYYVPPYTDVPVPEPVLDIAAMAAAGGLASTAKDLATWAGFLAEPIDDVLSADTVEEMCQPQTMADLERWQLAYGLGLMLLRTDDRIYVGHTGGMPGAITGTFVHRESSTGGVCLMNATSAPDPAALAVDLAAYLLEHEPVEPEPWRPGTETPPELVAILGRWFSEGQAFTFSVRSGRLEARLDSAPAHRPPSVFANVEGDLYRTESGREAGELLRISRDANNRVTKLNWATYLFTREPYAFGEWLDDAT